MFDRLFTIQDFPFPDQQSLHAGWKLLSVTRESCMPTCARDGTTTYERNSIVFPRYGCGPLSVFSHEQIQQVHGGIAHFAQTNYLELFAGRDSVYKPDDCVRTAKLIVPCLFERAPKQFLSNYLNPKFDLLPEGTVCASFVICLR